MVQSKGTFIHAGEHVYSGLALAPRHFSFTDLTSFFGPPDLLLDEFLASMFHHSNLGFSFFFGVQSRRKGYPLPIEIFSLLSYCSVFHILLILAYLACVIVSTAWSS